MIKISMALDKCSIEEAYLEYLAASGAKTVPVDNAIKDANTHDDILKPRKQNSGSSGSTNASAKQTGYLSHFKNAFT